MQLLHGELTQEGLFPQAPQRGGQIHTSGAPVQRRGELVAVGVHQGAQAGVGEEQTVVVEEGCEPRQRGERFGMPLRHLDLSGDDRR